MQEGILLGEGGALQLTGPNTVFTATGPVNISAGLNLIAWEGAKMYFPTLQNYWGSVQSDSLLQSWGEGDGQSQLVGQKVFVIASVVEEEL